MHALVLLFLACGHPSSGTPMIEPWWEAPEPCAAGDDLSTRLPPDLAAPTWPGDLTDERQRAVLPFQATCMHRTRDGDRVTSMRQTFPRTHWYPNGALASHSVREPDGTIITRRWNPWGQETATPDPERGEVVHRAWRAPTNRRTLGRLAVEGRTRAGVPVGTWTEYAEDGRAKTSVRWVGGKLARPLPDDPGLLAHAEPWARQDLRLHWPGGSSAWRPESAALPKPEAHPLPTCEGAGPDPFPTAWLDQPATDRWRYLGREWSRSHLVRHPQGLPHDCSSWSPQVHDLAAAVQGDATLLGQGLAVRLLPDTPAGILHAITRCAEPAGYPTLHVSCDPGLQWPPLQAPEALQGPHARAAIPLPVSHTDPGLWVKTTIPGTNQTVSAPRLPMVVRAGDELLLLQHGHEEVSWACTKAECQVISEPTTLQAVLATRLGPDRRVLLFFQHGTVQQALDLIQALPPQAIPILLDR